MLFSFIYLVQILIIMGKSYIQLLFQQIIIFINSNFYLHYHSILSILLPLKLW